ncbi:MAG: transcriptional regulator [Alphaproteobacteria bacterium]|nr:MAG: transcriptional regulator [Alphaproteobacteria bacterium]
MERNIRLNWHQLVEEAIKRRKEQKISQRRLAAIAGISQPTISRFEQRRKDIQLSSAIKILDVLGLIEK